MKISLAFFPYGGIEGRTFDCLVRELLAALRRPDRVEVRYRRVPGDALVSRSRSIVLSEFLAGGDDVLFMLDHDLDWPESMLVETCLQAAAEQAIVGGFYSVRARGVGFSGRLRDEGVVVRPGDDRLYEAEFLGGGFMAVPRAAIERIHAAGLRHRDEPAGRRDLALHSCVYNNDVEFWDFCRPLTVESRRWPGKHEYLSEDWALCYRAADAGVRTLYWAKPVLLHLGTYGYKMSESAPPSAPTKK
jgi:hypothetical protein